MNPNSVFQNVTTQIRIKETFCENEKAKSCQQAGCVILYDANFVIDVFYGTVQNLMVAGQGMGAQPRYDAFLSLIKYTFNKLSLCGKTIKPAIPRRVFYEELDPGNKACRLRREIPYFDTICRQRNKNFKKLRELLEDFFYIIPVDKSTCRQLRKGAYLNAYLEDRDSHLLMLTINLSHNYGPALLVTSDTELSNAVDEIRKKETIIINGAIYKTNKIAYKMGDLFAYNNFDCCAMNGCQFKPIAHYRVDYQLDKARKENNQAKVKRVKAEILREYIKYDIRDGEKGPKKIQELLKEVQYVSNG